MHWSEFLWHSRRFLVIYAMSLTQSCADIEEDNIASAKLCIAPEQRPKEH